MSLDIVKKNSSSPFHLQRSIVDQGGSGGAYESGGFNPDMVYNNDAANQAIESLGKVIGAGLSSRTAGDENEANKNKLKRLQDKGTRLNDKSKSADPERKAKLEGRVLRVISKIDNTKKDISKYEESIKPSLKSTLGVDLSKEAAKEKTKAQNYEDTFKTKNKIIDYNPIKLEQETKLNPILGILKKNK